MKLIPLYSGWIGVCLAERLQILIVGVNVTGVCIYKYMIILFIPHFLLTRPAHTSNITIAVNPGFLSRCHDHHGSCRHIPDR